MASMRDIKRRRASVESTGQITKAVSYGKKSPFQSGKCGFGIYEGA